MEHHQSKLKCELYNDSMQNWKKCPERMEISRLNIYESYQNKGYGTEVVKNLVKQGYKSLWVRADNARALHVYEKCGFVKKEATMFEMEIKNGMVESEENK